MQFIDLEMNSQILIKLLFVNQTFFHIWFEISLHKQILCTTGNNKSIKLQDKTTFKKTLI